MTGPRVYNLFPTLIGEVERWNEHLPRIAAMRFDWIYVNPFTRTGHSGSLYAVADYRDLNPALRGDDTRPDDERLRAFTALAAEQGIGVMVDLVVNHTAEDAALVHDHPEWYKHEADGAVAHPFALDPGGDPAKKTVWGDLAELDYTPRPERDALIAFVIDVARYYAGLGFTGFRCDAAYKIPGDVWRAIISAVREHYPQAVFVAETLGGPPGEVRQLRPAGFDALFNSSKWWDFRASWALEQYEEYRHIAPSIAFPESHDTPRLVGELPDGADVAARYRFAYLVAAGFSSGVMIPVGYEYGFATPLDVVTTTPQAWETARFDLSDFIARTNAIKAATPALSEEGPMQRLTGERSGVVALLRSAISGPSRALVLINPDPDSAADVTADLLAALGTRDPVDATAGLLDADDTGDAIVVPPLSVRIFTTRDRPRLAEPPASAGSDDARAVVIEAVTPELEAGRYAVKAVTGDRFVVEADIFREGHDAVDSVLKYREFGESEWRETPMRYHDNDRWRGAFVLERNARYEYTLEAWPDDIGTWHHATEKKRDAGQSIGLELIEGRALIAAARDRAGGSERVRLDAALKAYDALEDDGARADLMLADELVRVARRAPDRSRATAYPRTLELFVDRPAARFSAWYEFFPRSQSGEPGRHGTFRDAARRLPAVAKLGFDVVYLPPIHPIGHAFRKGKNNSLEPGPDDPGSPWAIGNEHGGHRAVEPKLGTLDDFAGFVAEAKRLGLEVAIDYALQCSPDHPYVREHPEWFQIRPDGTIKYAENPPKKYQDIVNFDWFGPAAGALWTELRDVIEFWVERGVTVFRVDNPHTKPYAFWEWMIRDVQSRRPDVLFLAEAFTRPKVMQQLAKIGFSQSYTYFTWRNEKWEIEQYLRELAHGPMAAYYRPNFWPNTPDILPPFLQSDGRAAFLIRFVLAATLSSTYGMYSGFELCENAALPGREEYANSEKYEIKVRDYEAPGNINAEIAAINRIRRDNVALHDWRNVQFHQTGDDAVLAYSKRTGTNLVFVVVTLDPFAPHETEVELPLARAGHDGEASYEALDLLGGGRDYWQGGRRRFRLEPERNPALVYRIETQMNDDSETPV